MQTSVLQRRKLSSVCTTFFFFFSTESTCIVCLAVDTLMLCVTSLQLDASLADTRYKLAVRDDNPDSRFIFDLHLYFMVHQLCKVASTLSFDLNIQVHFSRTTNATVMILG